MRRLCAIAVLFLAANAGAGTIRNADSCDISVMPAATLLLPYFEVDITSFGQTTLFTIINTSPTPAIAHVTLWTDWAHPVLDFPIQLTGYDVQAINLRDVLVNGTIAAPASACSPSTEIPPAILSDVRSALTVGRNASCGTTRVGGTHANAVGYVTIDVVASCDARVMTDPRAFDDLLFDNVLTGDYQVLVPDATLGSFAASSPLVHIRAVPEGGRAGERVETNLPYTFYDRYAGEGNRLRDRRQPLPSSFAVRYNQGGFQTHPSLFLTHFLIWREGVTGAQPSCPDPQQNREMLISGLVRFDERENATVITPGLLITGVFTFESRTNAAARISSSSSQFPPLTSGDIAGWMALNLDNGGSTAYGVTPPGRNFRPPESSTKAGPRPSQNWVTSLMYVDGKWASAFDAIALANGCSPAPAVRTTSQSGIYHDIVVVGPGANSNP
jgi:hypothetical protein